MLTEKDLQYYKENKDLLDKIPNKRTKNHTIQCIRDDKLHPYIGLENLGATCYLNTLIQSLFANKDFVESILLATVSTTSTTCILYELQKLFARLLLSNHYAATTESLLTSFGWNKSQLFEQHDIHEFFSIFLDSLRNESNDINTLISTLIEGKLNGK